MNSSTNTTKQVWGGSMILENELYVGSHGDAVRLIEQKDNHNIRAILTAAQLPELWKFNVPQQFNYKQLKLLDIDSQDIQSSFDESIQFIDGHSKNEGGVLVHCMAGMSRSVTICIAYLMKTKNMRYEEAFEFVKQQHPWSCPNDGFLLQLQEYDKKLYEPQNELQPMDTE